LYSLDSQDEAHFLNCIALAMDEKKLRYTLLSCKYCDTNEIQIH